MIFDLRSSIVKSIFDCHLFGVMLCNIFSYSDSSLQELVKRILPLCSNYSTVVRFIEGRFQHNQVSTGDFIFNHIYGIICTKASFKPP